MQPYLYKSIIYLFSDGAKIDDFMTLYPSPRVTDAITC